MKDNGKLSFSGKYYGFKLNQDTIIVGNTVMNDGFLDLNGYQLLVKGDMQIDSGNISVNSGLLRIEGDAISNLVTVGSESDSGNIEIKGNMSVTAGSWKLANKNSNNISVSVGGDLTQTGGNITIGNGTLNVGGSYSVLNDAVLVMQESDGRVNISKDFTMKSSRSAQSWTAFYSGVLSIGGNLYQYSNEKSDNLYCQYNHSIELLGDRKHIVKSESTHTMINNLIINKGASVSFEGSINGVSITGSSFSSTGNALSIGNNHLITGMVTGKATLTISNGSNTASIPVTVNNGVPAGDVNLDGKFNIADVVMLQRWLVKNGGLTYWKAGDMDGNGRINAIDLTLMKRTLMK